MGLSVTYNVTLDKTSNATHEPRLTATNRSDSVGREQSNVGLHAFVRAQTAALQIDRQVAPAVLPIRLPI